MAHTEIIDGKVILRDDWDIGDVHQAASDQNIKVTDDEAEDVLHLIANNFDANLGIHWETLYAAIDRVKG
tara:strand:- start:3167 stop:3376 length:210 start_codon:yes stop_codon:yes gene_type:complete